MGALEDNSIRLQVIVPAHNAEPTLPACIDALFAAGFRADGILVVDDGSGDRTGAIARAAGLRVKRHDIAQRPARARNAGAAEVDADVLVFIDADVVVHPDLQSKIRRHFADPSVSAVIGSYDANPGGPVVSRYRNLLHHVTHQKAGGKSQTFWSGIGAIRQETFEAAGGFDPAWEDIEDVELGLRVTEAGGTILLDPTMQGTHLKLWTVRSMFRTDLFGRAVPWTRLMRAGRLRVGTLNTAWAHRVSAACVLFGAIALAASPFEVRALWGVAGAAVGFAIANATLLRRFSRIADPVFAVQSMPFHIVHYTAAVLGYLRVRLFERSA
ncbi:MAG: glycosyltransferase family A protein [Pseudomonadota bacterium]